MSKGDVEYVYSNESPYYQNLTFMQKRAYNLRNSVFSNKMTISEIATKYSWVASLFGKTIVKNRFKVDSEIADIMYEFLMEIYKIPESSEKAIHYIINPNFVPFQPLEGTIDDLEIRILICYGDKDWMDDDGARRMQRKNMKNFKLKYINDSGHQITMDNPEGLLEHLMDDSHLSLII